MTKQELKTLLEKYFKGTLSPDEKEALDDWYGSFDNKEGDLHLLYFEQLDKENVRRSIYKKITEQVTIPVHRKPVPVRWAAAVILLAVSSIVLITFGDALYQKIYLLTQEEIEVPRGMLTKKILPDGSKVWLRAGSKLSFNRYFWKISGERSLHLEGEGFFDVVHDKKKPFLVHSGKKTVRVMGTSFDVKSIPEIDLYEVTVQTGKVQVSDSSQVLVELLPSDKVSIRSYDKPKIIRRQISSERSNYKEWMEGKLYFDNQRFEEIVWFLRKLYGTDIQFSNSLLKDCRFSGDFTGLSLNQVLKIMQEVHPFERHYTQNRSILIAGDIGCNAQ